MTRLVLLLLLVLPVAPLSAGDWPQWRGPSRDGVAEATLPTDLPDEPRLLWRVEVGTGHSSPVVVGGRVYQFARQGGDEVLRALRLADGGEIWSWALDTPYRRNPAAFLHGKGPKSTPIVSGDTICTLGIAGRLSCLDRHTGELRWSKDFVGRFSKTQPDFGAATSPAVVGGRLVAYVGGVDAGALTAYELETGEEVWSWTDDPPAYSSPALATFAGVAQIVAHSRFHVIGLDATSGERLWQTRFTTPYDQSNITPLVHKTKLVLSGLETATFAIEPRPDARGNWQLHKVWRRDELSLYMSSPVTAGNLVFGLADRRKGQLFCLDAETGDILWTSDGREGDNASLILAGDQLVVLTTEGVLQIGPASRDGWEPTVTWSVADSPTWAHLAFLGDRILVKDKTGLAAWALD